MDTTKLVGDFQAHSLSLVLAEAGIASLELGRLVSEPFSATLGAFAITAAKATIEGVCLGAPPAPGQRPQRRSITSSAAVLAGVELALLDRQRTPAEPLARLAIAQLELPRGFQLGTSGELTIPEAILEGVTVACEDILRLPAWLRDGMPRRARHGRAATPGDEAMVPPPPRPVQAPANLDSGHQRVFSFLDGLEGKLDVDLFLDTSISVIGQRSETHKFRIPIHDGSIDFARFEGNVNWLARSVLDIEVAHGKLYLEKDVPLIPFDNKVIISWPLDADEQALAERNRVRLRTLLGWQLPAQHSDKKLPLVLHQIAGRNIDAQLSLGRPAIIDLGPAGRLLFGKDDRPALDDLVVRGELHHATAESLPDTVLHLTANSLSGALESLHLADSEVAVRTIDCHQIGDVSLWFTGFLPSQLHGTIARITVDAVHVQPLATR